MRRVRVILGLALCLAASWGTGCGRKDAVLATVGGQSITTADLAMALSNLPENYQILANSTRGKHKILENLVKKDLLVLEAERRGYEQGADVKKRIRDLQAKNRQRLQQELATVQKRLAMSDRQVYENVLLNEFNTHLKQDDMKTTSVPESDLQAYYDDYARKLKLLNPAAKVPAIETVAAQIKAILVEEQLIKRLEKNSKVFINEERFQQLYGEGGATAVPEAQGTPSATP